MINCFFTYSLILVCISVFIFYITSFGGRFERAEIVYKDPFKITFAKNSEYGSRTCEVFNTFTSVAYVIVFIVSAAMTHFALGSFNCRQIIRHLCILVTGLFSSCFHGNRTHACGICDTQGMALIVVSYIACFVSSVYVLPPLVTASVCFFIVSVTFYADYTILHQCEVTHSYSRILFDYTLVIGFGAILCSMDFFRNCNLSLALCIILCLISCEIPQIKRTSCHIAKSTNIFYFLSFVKCISSASVIFFCNCAVLEKKTSLKSLWWIFTAIVLFIFGALLQDRSIEKETISSECSQDLQVNYRKISKWFHGSWHVLSAAAILCLEAFFLDNKI